MYSHRGAYLNALGEVIHNGHGTESVYLWTLPMFHCNGWCCTWGITAAAGRHVCLPAVRGDHMWQLINEERVTHMSGAPVVLSTLAEVATGKNAPGPLTATIAGAPPSPTVIEALERIDAKLIHVYGLTETYGPYTICERQDAWAQLDSTTRSRMLARQGVGMVQAERARVVDPDMNDVAADGMTMGEIVMRGNNVMKGYYADERATAEAFHGGWFHSGDLGVMHPDGYVQLLDRAKDVVISGGENISTIEVEQALLRHAAVADAAVIGVPDAKWGEVCKAFVVLRDGSDARRSRADRVRARPDRSDSRRRRRWSSSPSCRAPRPARSRSTSCASASGPGSTGASRVSLELRHSGLLLRSRNGALDVSVYRQRLRPRLSLRGRCATAR